MISLEAREIEEILKGLYPKKQAFFIGCSGWKGICNPGGELQLQRMKKDLELRGAHLHRHSGGGRTLQQRPG